MTSARQVEANRANARKSTGPRTAEGKATSARNAARHGLTGALDSEAVREWYRVILHDPEADPDPFEQDPALRASVDLAEAEAHLTRVLEAEDRYLRDAEGELSEWEEELIEERKWIGEWLEDGESERRFRNTLKDGPLKRSLLTDRGYRAWIRQGERLLLRFRGISDRRRVRRLKDRERTGRMLARYRASAEARRQKALRHWIEENTKRTQSTPEAAEC